MTPSGVHYSNTRSLANYYPFGMMQPGRQWAADSSLFGFQGQMKDDEVAGRGNTITAEFWEYDTRTGRRWNLDPKPTVGVSMYSAFMDNPVMNTDPLGDIATQALEDSYIKPLGKAYDNMVNDETENLHDLQNKRENTTNQSDRESLDGDIAKSQQQLGFLIGERTQFNMEVDKIRSSQITYDEGSMESQSPFETRDENGKVYADPHTGTIYAANKTIFQGGTIGEKRHEFKHLFQFETGKISFSANGLHGGLLDDQYDEGEAYQVMHAFGEKMDYGILNKNGQSYVHIPPGYSGLPGADVQFDDNFNPIGIRSFSILDLGKRAAADAQHNIYNKHLFDQ